MKILIEHLEQLQDPIINQIKSLALKYSKKHCKFEDMKFEINIDIKSKSVIINSIVYRNN